nr:hypothetical protein CFP56_64669 [Quercus suber]
MLSITNILRCQRPITKQISVRILIRNWHKEAIPVVWEKPEKGWTKLNFDGSSKESIGRANSTIAELAALRRGLELVLENGWNDVWLEGDAKTLIDIIAKRRQVKSSEVQRHISDINLIILELDNCLVTHVYREGIGDSQIEETSLSAALMKRCTQSCFLAIRDNATEKPKHHRNDGLVVN